MLAEQCGFVYYCNSAFYYVNEFRRNYKMSIVASSNPETMSTTMMIVWIVIMVAIMYFLMIRPQKKEQKRISAMLNDMAVGDSVVTTSGFYGVVLDITEEDVIVEFGNNKNCRIPMRKAAIAEVEKAGSAE